MKELLKRIQNKFQIKDELWRNETKIFITAESGQLVQLLTYLKQLEGFSHLALISAVDWMEEGVFQITYLLNHPDFKWDLGVRIKISRENAEMSSIHHLWKSAATYQREMKEMIGIHFPGSPRVDEPLILEGWDNIPPMRRDFDTKKYSEETYFPRPGRTTHDPAEYMKDKIYPEFPPIEKRDREGDKR